MNKFSLVTQIGMIVVAGAIVILYIQPKITTIRDTQDLTASYEVETNNVSQVNENLKVKVATIDAIASKDLQALTRFLPDTVDEISVLKDLSIIIESQSISEYDIAYSGNNIGREVNDEEVASSDSSVGREPTNNVRYKPTEYYFSVDLDTSYAQLKALLTKLETNDYLFQITNLKISDGEDSNVKAEMSITVFAQPAVASEITE